MSAERVEAVVIGSGFGGLGAALSLAEAGRRVVVCEAVNYPGGCASTHTHRGARFESGATMLAGLGEGQWLRGWLDRLDLDLDLRPIDPVVTLRTPTLTLAVPADRDAWVDRAAALPGGDPDRVRAFFATQGRAADVLWQLFDDPSLLPPLGPRALLRHLALAPAWLGVARWIGQPLTAVLAHHGLADHTALRQVLDAFLQITVQTDSAHAEAPFALAALDFFFRGTRHVHGGVGALASALVDGVEQLGGEVRFSTRVKGLTRTDDGDWIVRTRRGDLRTPVVVANTLPQDLATLADAPTRRLSGLADRVRDGWGAVLLYRTVRGDALPAEAHHLQLVHDPSRPLVAGNHVLASVSAADEDRAPGGLRTATISTHVRVPPDADAADVVARVQDRMRATIAARAPALEAATVEEWTASPRTFERFTRRSGGFVGGVPRTTGLSQYLALWPRQALPGVYLVGDSVLFGQSTLATAVGGQRVAATIIGRGSRGAARAEARLTPPQRLRPLHTE